MSVFDANENSASWVLVLKIVMGAAMVVAGPIMALRTVPTFISAYRSSSWPTVEGTIIRAEVKSDQPLGRRGTEYQPEIDYSYSVGGKRLLGNQIGFRGYGSNNKHDAEDLIAKYAVGTKHPVAYNPTNPSDAALEVGTHWLTYFGLLIVFVLAGVYVMKDHLTVLRGRRSSV